MVGYEEMLAQWSELSPGAPSWPECYVFSCWLANSMHIDLDSSRSHAIWVRTGGGEHMSEGWYFCWPRHSVALRLQHGTCMSWDGRAQPHCSALPSTISFEDELISVFVALPKDAMSILRRRMWLREQLRLRCTKVVPFDRASFCMNAFVYVRRAVGQPRPGMSKSALQKWDQVNWVVSRGQIRQVQANEIEVQLLDHKGHVWIGGWNDVSNRVVKVDTWNAW